MSAPAVSFPDATTICALPLESVPEPRLVPPKVNVTEPVGVPLLALTVIVTVALWAVVMLEGLADTVTVGVINVGAVTVIEPVPDALLYVEELEESGV